MSSVVELVLQPQHLPSLLGGDGGALQRLAAAAGARAGALLEDGVARIRLAGAPSACAAAELALWHAAGESACDASGWYYLDPRGRVHGPYASAQLRGWWAAGHWRPDQPVRNGASTAWLRVGALLHGVAAARADAAAEDDMDVDTAAADALASWRSDVSAAHSDNDAGADLPMLEAVPAAADAVRLVVDTCVLLARLPQLLRAAETLRGHAFAVIPWTAVCELDGLKRSADGNVAKLAREAIRGLAAALGGGGDDSFFRGESAAEWRAAVAEADQLVPGGRGSGDDRILATAMRLRAAGSRVLLVTNDANLRLKALVNGLPACADSGLPATPAALADVVAAPPPPPPPPLLLRAASAEEHAHGAGSQAASAEPIDVDALDELMREAGRGSRPRQQRQPMHSPAPLVAQSPAPLRDFDAVASVDAAMAALLRGAGPVFDAVLLAEYGAEWLATMELPTLSTGRDLLRAFDKHWRSCFAERLSSRARAAVASALESLSALGRRGGFGEAERCALAHRACTAVAELLGALPTGLGEAAALTAARADVAALLRSQTSG